MTSVGSSIWAEGVTLAKTLYKKAAIKPYMNAVYGFTSLATALTATNLLTTPLGSATKFVVSYYKYLITKLTNPLVAPAIEVFSETKP